MSFKTHVSFVSLSVLAGALAACGGRDDGSSTPLGAAGAPGAAGAAGDARALSRVDPAGEAECPAGGSVVSSGVDDDGDGALGDGEIEARNVVCNREPPGPPAEGAPLSRSSRVPPGEACPLGGSRVEGGRDDDGDGVLDDGEVETVTHVCDAALLTRMQAEPAGEHCAEGGIAFLSGRDDDGDGVLGPAEVEATGYECTDRLARDVVVRTAEDVALLAGIRSIEGSLTVPYENGEGAPFVALDLPKLEVVGASVSIHSLSYDPVHVSMPALVAIGGELSASEVASLDLRTLRGVGGDLSVKYGDLTGLGGLAALERVGGSLRVQSNHKLLDAALPALRAVGGELRVSGNVVLAAAGFALDEGPASLTITGNDALARFTFRSTPPPYDACEFGFLRITSNQALTSASVEARCATRAFVSSNDALDELELVLGGADQVRIESPALRALTLRNGQEPFEGFRANDFALDAPIESLSFNDQPATFRTLDVRHTRLTSFGLSAAPYGGVWLYDQAGFDDNPLLEQLVLGVQNPSQGVLLDVRDHAALRRFEFLGVGGYYRGTLVFVDNPRLNEVKGLEEVRRLEGHLTVIEGAFERFDWPKLTTATSGLGFYGLPTLRQADFSGLESAGYLSFFGTGLEAWPASGKLAHAGTISARGNPALQNVALGALGWVDQTVELQSNASLHALDFGSLYHAQELRFLSNPNLSVCAIESVFAAVDAPIETQQGNDADCHD